MAVKKNNKSEELDFFVASTESSLNIPFVEGGVKAGFPSPAADFMDVPIDLNVEIIRNPSATFFCRVSGDSMQDIGISDGDLLVIDKSIENKDGKVAVCYIDGEFTLKKIKIEKDCCWLIPANDKYKPIKVTSDNDFVVWGVVTFVIKQL